MTDAAIDIRAGAFKPGTSDAEIEAAAAKASQHRRRTGDFADGFFLDAQAGQDRRNHHWRHIAVHDLAHHINHLVVKNFTMIDYALQGFLRGHRHVFINCREHFSAWRDRAA